MIKFSVVCPVYNSETFIVETIDNIISQSLPPDELVLVDDGSTDATVTLIKDYLEFYSGPTTFKLVAAKHKGPGAARNIGIRSCRNEWISFIDSDDKWDRKKLQTIGEYVANNPESNIFCHSEEQLSLDGAKTLLDYGNYYQPTKQITTQLYQRNLFSPSATVCRGELFLKKGFFDEELSSGQDYELWLKLAPLLKPVFIREVLGFYYERQGNISSQRAFKRLKNLLKIQARYMSTVPVGLVVERITKSVLQFVLSLLKDLVKFKWFTLVNPAKIN